GVNLPFVIWNEQVEGFDMEAYAHMPKPVVIAVSSTWATRRYGGLQLTATPATYYYLNPNIPEANYILNVVNPQHYKGARFTTEATILEIVAPNGWYYRKCALCNMKIAHEASAPHCPDHGPQPIPNYGYCFRAVIDDGTATTTVTCFSPEAHTFVPECNTVVATIGDQETEAIPAALKEAENKTYIFQYHFGKKAAPGNSAFTLDTVFRPSTQPLLTLPTTEVTTPSRLEIQPETFAPTKTPPTTEVTTHYPVDIQSQESASTKTKDQEPQAQPEARLIRARRQLFEEEDPATKKPRK
ncbi:DNA helicase, partial [Tanacetum coccineum]